ncbi:ESX secretion-associated protein EspG [Nocardia higoensis]|uniref:ESX secretion-associated protein EspG n=1 Tax=Nocardia higoensis TaxID=228599 RepID=A0ABS0D8W7_9NOCA|nr:ESX secretion-associated protein EspG [Nocardia higoensis]MBF6353309.1 ESX secretion-associated protein EspG [Nocardia higoensis]
MTWTITPLEFWAAWETLGRDRMPFPLSFRAEAETLVEFDRDRRAAATGLVARMGSDDSLYHALRAIAHADVRIEMFGYRRDGRDRMIRACAAIESDAGAVAAQFPGRHFAEGGNLRIDLCSPQTVVSRLLSVLPSTPPGRGPVVDIHRDEFNRPAAPRSHRRSVGEHATRLLTRAFHAYAEIRVDTGPALDGSTDKGVQVCVVDYVDDGRYLIRESDRIEAIPARADRIQQEVQRMVDRAIVEARETAWRR